MISDQVNCVLILPARIGKELLIIPKLCVHKIRWLKCKVTYLFSSDIFNVRSMVALQF